MNAAENNLKRADELRRQQEKQLSNLQKQAEEAQKYKFISEEIKKIEQDYIFLKLKEIDGEIKLENEINIDAEKEVDNINHKEMEIEKSIDEKVEKLDPVRIKNIENLSKIKRLNLELKSIDEENNRIKDDIDNLKHSIRTIDDDEDKEKVQL